MELAWDVFHEPLLGLVGMAVMWDGRNCCLNSSTVELFLKNEPQSTATKNLVHLAQTVRDGIVSKYDYGDVHYNVEHYGEARPPVYNLSNIPGDLPLFLSYGGRDALSDVKDVENLLDRLRLHAPDKLSVQYVKEFAHADFIIGVTAKDVVYNQIVAFFRRHQ
ncbi:sterol esterase [Sarracenia purpurea var. burkii]